MISSKVHFFVALAGIASILSAALAAQTTFPTTTTVPAAIPDNDPLGMTLDVPVSGITNGVSDLTVDIAFDGNAGAAHTWAGDLIVTVIAPGGSPQADVFNRPGRVGGAGSGDSSDLDGPYTFADTGTADFWADLAAITGAVTLTPSGTYFPTTVDGTTVSFAVAFNGLTPAQANGTWTVFVSDNAGGDVGLVESASITITDAGSNAIPVIAVDQDSSTTPVAVTNGGTITVALNDTVASLDLQFDVTDADVADTLTLATTVAPSANINGFVQSEWDAGPAVSPLATNPATGTFDTVGAITVTLDADDGAAGGTAQFVFTIDVVPPPLSGTVTVANGNPGGTFDYADLGDVFDDLEAVGVSGPLVIELYDDGGAFTSTASYALGGPITGHSAANSITVVAAAGENPVLTGSAAIDPFAVGISGTIAFNQMGDVTVSGLEVSGGDDFGIGFISSTTPFSNQTVSSCTVHNVNGVGIWIYQDSTGVVNTDVTVENNFVYDVAGDSGTTLSGFGTFYGPGGIGYRTPGTNWNIRHNTLLMNRAPTTATAGISQGVSIATQTAGVGLASFEYNIVIAAGAGISVFDMPQVDAPTASDRNILQMTGGATVFQADTAGAGATSTALTDWQTATTLDANSVDTDPALANTTAGSEDLHLTAGSTNAEDAAVGSTATVDIDGDTRPQGAERDIGADERVTGPVAPIITSSAPTTATVGVLYTYTVTASGSPAPTFSVVGNPAWLIWNGTDTLSGTPAAGDVGTTGTITITATNGTAPDDTEAFSITVSANAVPTIAVTENTNAVAADQVITIALNDTVASMALSFIASDADVGDTVTFTTSVSPSANITTFTQSEWDQATAGNPTTAATPATGTVDVAGLITVIITATDNNSAVGTFRFFILVPVAGNTAPTVSIPTGSAFTGSVVAGFTYNGTVSTALANATLQLDDAESDAIDVTNETGTVPGVTTPGTGTGIAAGSPANFTGTPTSQGTFVVTYTITDNNTAPVVFTVTFVIGSGSTGGGGGGGGGDGGGCSTGTSTSLLVLLALLGLVVVAYRVRGSKA